MSYFSEFLSICATGLVGYLVWFLKKQYSYKSASAKAMKLLLRGQIYALHNRYMERGSISPQELYEFTELYEVYKEFKGNGTATHMKADIDRLPLKEE